MREVEYWIYPSSSIMSSDTTSGARSRKWGLKDITSKLLSIIHQPSWIHPSSIGPCLTTSHFLFAFPFPLHSQISDPDAWSRPETLTIPFPPQMLLDPLNSSSRLFIGVAKISHKVKDELQYIQLFATVHKIPLLVFGR